MSHHQFEITLTGGSPRLALPPKTMIVDTGDTVEFVCKDGSVRVLFDISPFSQFPKEDIHDGEIRKIKDVAKEARFPGKCFVTPPGGAAVIGWTEQDKRSGGDVVVRP